MIAVILSSKPRPTSARGMSGKAPVEHDLPVLGATLAPPVRIDWSPLLDSGVTPSLVLGAERRLRGPR